MKSRILTIILIVSLAFNSGFIIKYVYKMCNKPKAMMPLPAKVQMKSQRIEPSEEMKEVRNENMRQREMFFMELAKPVLDMETVNELVLQLDASQRVMEHTVMNHFISMRLEMDEIEAQNFFGRFQNKYENRKEKFVYKRKNGGEE